MSAKSGAPRRGIGGWVQGLACGALVTLATPTAVLAGALLVPSIVVFAFEHADGKPVTRAVLLFGLATGISPMLALWSGGHSMTTALALLAEPTTLAAAWAAQGAGWLLAELLPLAVRAVEDVQVAARIRGLRAERAKIAEQWGIAASPGDAAAKPEGDASAA